MRTTLKLTLRSIPPLVVCVMLLGWSHAAPARAGEVCTFDPDADTLVCREVGGDRGGVPPVGSGDGDPKLRYLYTSFDGTVGDCYYWSATPGGLDAWDPAHDALIIPITTTLPVCPSIPVTDPVVRGWEVFRSWDLASPTPSMTPATAGITGIPTHIEAPEPATIVHTEVLPDGRPLDVRARVTALIVDWGDGVLSHHRAVDAAGYPNGSVFHTFTLKTCPPWYREHHPSGALCHPTLPAYTITATYVWTGEFDVGAGWVTLGTIDTTTSLTYDVDEARGTPTP